MTPPAAEASSCAWRALCYSNDADLSPAVSRQLFPPPLRATAARLETFAACAFRHFLRYGLALTEREPPGVTGLDLSRVYHHVLQALVSSAVERRHRPHRPQRPRHRRHDRRPRRRRRRLAPRRADDQQRPQRLPARPRRAARLAEVVAAHREMLRRGAMRPARSALPSAPAPRSPRCA